MCREIKFQKLNHILEQDKCYFYEYSSGKILDYNPNEIIEKYKQIYTMSVSTDIGILFHEKIGTLVLSIVSNGNEVEFRLRYEPTEYVITYILHAYTPERKQNVIEKIKDFQWYKIYATKKLLGV